MKLWRKKIISGHLEISLSQTTSWEALTFDHMPAYQVRMVMVTTWPSSLRLHPIPTIPPNQLAKTIALLTWGWLWKPPAFLTQVNTWFEVGWQRECKILQLCWLKMADLVQSRKQAALVAQCFGQQIIQKFNGEILHVRKPKMARTSSPYTLP